MLIQYQEHPYNAAPPSEALVENFITPTARFFVRTHGDVPQLDASSYLFSVDGAVKQPMKLNMSEIRQRYAEVSVIATLQCAGNRRGELVSVAPINGEVMWSSEVLGTGVWTGVRLRDVLMDAGVSSDMQLHVAFEGYDSVQREGKEVGFGGSIPLEKALSKHVLLAYALNNEPLDAAHGAPLRVIVPGYYGARSVKWLKAIHVQAEPSQNYFQQVAYRLYGGAKPDAAAPMLGQTILNSVICTPNDEAVLLGNGNVTLKGYAVGGESGLARVEVTTDGGNTWHTTRLQASAERWAWRLWEITLPLEHGMHTVAARAWDEAGNTQPPHLKDVWNTKGYANNAWHWVTFVVRTGSTGGLRNN
jgi:sulfite oxidase